MKCINILKLIKTNKIDKYKKHLYIKGWIKNKRNTKIGIIFLDINDGSSINNLQVIINPKKIKNFKKNIIKITSGCSISLKGVIKNSPKSNKKEIHAVNIKILGYIENPETYPISPKYHSLEYLRKISHLRPRTKIINTISKIRNTLIFSLHNFFQKRNFIWIPTPIITSLDTEGSSKLFKIKEKNFFKKKAFLTVSGQLNLETYACSLSKVYNFGPIFRAERSITNKHLAEFWMLETEIAFANLKQIITISKNMLYFCFKQILKKNYEEIIFLSEYHKNKNILNNLEKIINKKITEINYNEIIKIIKKKENFFSSKIKWGSNIFPEHEKFLTEKYFKTPIIIKNFPQKIKAFYMKKNIDNTVSSMDIIFPFVGEIIGGGEREENIKKLIKNIKIKKLNEKKYWWYKDLRKYGTVKHSGFGMGFERLLMYITNMKNIRDLIPFPRYINYLKF